MKRRTDLTAKRARELLVYNPHTGALTNRVTRSSRAMAGTRAGTLRKDGYRHVNVDGACYLEHGVIWLMQTGAWPKCLVEHKRGKSNRWSNLREADYAQNAFNAGARKTSQTKTRGVWAVRGKYQTSIQVGAKRLHLGTFKSRAAAAAAYQREAKRLHGEFFYQGGLSR